MQGIPEKGEGIGTKEYRKGKNKKLEWKKGKRKQLLNRL